MQIDSIIKKKRAKHVSGAAKMLTTHNLPWNGIDGINDFKAAPPKMDTIKMTFLGVCIQCATY